MRESNQDRGRKALCITVIVLVLGMPGCFGNDNGDTGLPGRELQSLLDNSVGDDLVPGVVMAVETPDGVWIGAAGKANLATGENMIPDIQVRIASITKMFTATLIMKLVEENKLGLGDTVEQWLPDVIQNGSRVTVGMLLNHTSGIPDHEEELEFWDRLAEDPNASWSSEDVLGFIHDKEFLFEPGTNWSYCNTGYYLLGMIAEAATGNNVSEEIDTRFFSPLGMDRTALTRAGEKTEPYAHDYSWFKPYNQLTDTSSWNLSWDWTAGGAVTTAEDMLVWTRALFGGDVVGAGTLEQMTTPVFPSTLYGFGVFAVDKDPFLGERLITHSGSFPGVNAQWHHYPDSGRTIFVALNRQDFCFMELPPVNVDAVMNAILTDVHDILNGTK